MNGRFLVSAILFLGMASHLFGQASATGAINGTVTDPSGASVANASVVLKNTATNIETRVNTNAEGQYRIFQLLPGPYSLSVEAPGFKTTSIELFQINVGQTLTQDVTLTLGTTTERVEVQAQEELLQRTSVELSTVVNSKVMQDLPLNGRDYTSLISLDPGANGSRLNGQWTDGNAFLLDGTNNTTILGASSASIPTLDSIQEFNIVAQSTKAEYGSFLGATVNVATKSGTNELHGSGWEFVRNNIFQARNPVTQATLTQLPPYRRNQFGGTLGGPVYIPKLYRGKDRTFFFFSFERYTDREQSTSIYQVPTAQELAGNFANDPLVGRNIYDPATTTTDPITGLPVRQQFTGNVIPPSRLDPLTVAYLKLMLPAPNYFDPNNIYGNRIDNFPYVQNKNDYTVRIDHHFSDKDTAWFRYQRTDNNIDSRVTGLVGLAQSIPRQNYAASWMHVFTPAVFLESRFAYVDFPSEYQNTLTGGSGALTSIGFSGAKIAKYGLPDFLGSGVATPYLLGFYGTLTKIPFGFTEALNWSAGKHTLKFGGEIAGKRFQNVATGHHYFFSNTQTEDPNNPGSTGSSLASTLLGLPSSIQYYNGDYTETFNNWSLYGEDEWKVSKTLTLTYGLRYDSFPPIHFANGLINGDWDANTGVWLIGGSKLPPPCATAGAAPCIPGTGNLADLPNGNMIQLAKYSGIRYPIHDNFGPRAGVAWSFLPSFVLRAGYGVYYDTASSTAQEGQNIFGNWPTAYSVQPSYNQVGAPLISVSQIDGSPVAGALPSLVPWGTQCYCWDPQKKNARSQQWSLEIQRQLTQNSIVSATYVGNYQSRLDMTLVANTATTPGPGSAAQVNARRPFPFYGTDTYFGTSLGRSDYNALELLARHNFAHGLQGQFSYTWSKAMDNGTNGWYSGNPQDSYNLNADWGPSNSDVTHMFKFSGLIELPFGQGKRWLNHGIASAILGNWQLNGINVIQSGTPIVLSINGDVANVGNDLRTYERPDVVGNPYISNPTANQWFNQAAFAVPVFAYGSAGRGLLRNPWFYNSDLSLFKNIPIRERARFQLRLEAFNAFNFQTLGNVNGDASAGNQNFGRITNIGSTPRQIQLAAKLTF